MLEVVTGERPVIGIVSPMLFKQITLQDVELLRDIRPTRRRFSEYPIIRERGDEYIVSTMFQSIDRLFERDTKIYTRDGPYGPYCFLSDKGQITRALDWQEKHKNLIFLRDMLDCSIALDYNLASQQVYTDLGFAEHNAKINRDPAAAETLVAACVAAVQMVSVFGDSDAICAVPPSPGKDWDLPTEIARLVSEQTGKPNVSSSVRFTADKKSIKSVALSDKWSALEEGKLTVDRAVSGKKIILIDDKYQSGTTSQFVAGKLYEADATEVNGLFCIKTWRNTDNQ